MLVVIERKSRSGWPAVPHSPQHRQVAQLIEAIAGMNKHRATWLRILSREGVTQGDPLLMVLYGITLVPFAEELRAADPGLLSLFYADNAALDGLARRSAQLLKLLMKRGTDQGYFPELAKSLFISDTPGQEAGSKRELAAEGLTLNFVSGSRYLGAYLGLQEELEA